MHLTDKQEAAKPPPWIRVQDCAIVAISTPSRYACPDGKVYTGTELYQAPVRQLGGISEIAWQRNHIGPPQGWR